MTALEKIVKNRIILINKEKKESSFREIISGVDKLVESGYTPAPFNNRLNNTNPFLIAEIKRSSPSKGLIREDFDAAEIARAYDSSVYVDAVSILTEPDFFSGSYEYIKIVKETTKKPVLMKDFIIDSYQIYKGYLLGASAILLIASILDNDQIEDFVKIAKELKMNILFETHSVNEFKKALSYDIDIIGINNRNLKTMVTDVKNTIKILEQTGKPEGRMIISESGIDSREDINMLMESEVDGFLIGERFMKSENIAGAVSCLFGDENEETTC